jgi:excinuclease ABC subunit B
MKYNAEHGITPETVRKAIRNSLEQEISARKIAREAVQASEEAYDRGELIRKLEAQMLEAAEKLDFERAAEFRDRLRELEAAPTWKHQHGAPRVSARPATRTPRTSLEAEG